MLRSLSQLCSEVAEGVSDLDTSDKVRMRPRECHKHRCVGHFLFRGRLVTSGESKYPFVGRHVGTEALRECAKPISSRRRKSRALTSRAGTAMAAGSISRSVSGRPRPGSSAL